MELHQAAEAKELIAEHLCSIIQQNEMRKANKLAELMTKLNLGGMAADGGLTPPDSTAANTSDMKFFQRTPTPAIHRSQLPKLQSPSAVLVDPVPLPTEPELPPQRHATDGGNRSSAVNTEQSDVDASALDQESQPGPLQATHAQHDDSKPTWCILYSTTELAVYQQYMCHHQMCYIDAIEVTTARHECVQLFILSI